VEFPTDFTLHEIAHFDDQTGILTPLEHHLNFGNFVQFLPKPEANANNQLPLPVKTA